MILVVMGVSGSGKSTIGAALAQRLGWDFIDGDDFHSEANKRKMASGVPLTDGDRMPWLQSIAGAIRSRVESGTSAVFACSALRQAYRDVLAVDAAVRFVYLKGTSELFQNRLTLRRGHFMPASLLQSQFETLEEPAEAIVVRAALRPDEIVESIIGALKITEKSEARNSK